MTVKCNNSAARTPYSVLSTECLLRLIVIAVASIFSGCSDKQPPAPPAAPPAVRQPAAFQPTPEIVAENNRGVALMGQFDYQAAFDLFSKLAHDNPDWTAGKINLAIAQFNLNRPGSDDLPKAEELLQQVLAVEPNNLRANYCFGVLLFNDSKMHEALDRFKLVAAADPHDAYAAYFVGRCLFEEEKFADALAAYETAIGADPYLQSAYYAEFQALQRLGKADEAKAKLDVFQRMAKNPQAEKVDIKYTRMGPKAMAMTVDAQSPASEPMRPEGAIFADGVPLPLVSPLPADVKWTAADEKGKSRPPSITVCDIDGDGQLDLFIAGGLTVGDKRLNAVLLRRGDKWLLDVDHPLARVTDVQAALWGDYDNDGLTDVYLCRNGANQLWRQTAKNKWEDVTERTHTAGQGGTTIDGAMYDADHDGDLDLFLIHSDGPNVLLINNGDGTFRSNAREQGVAGDGRPATGLVVAPLDNDHVADVIVLHDKPPHEVFRNDRLWKYEHPKGWDKFASEPIGAAVAADPEADGRVRLLTSGLDPLIRWASDAGGVWCRNVLSGSTANNTSGGPREIALADVVGEGMPAVILSIGDGWMVESATVNNAWLEQPPQPVGPVILQGGVAQPPGPASWALLNDDAARGPSVVAFEDVQGPVIWRPGPGRYNFLTLQFTGRHEPNKQMRSNASGIGVRGAIRVGSRWTAISTYRTSSGPGQSLQPVCVGLRGAEKADFLQIDWPDGAMETEMDLAAGKLHHIEEQNRLPTSCPLLFTWNGEKYQFVTDCLGVGGLGYAIGPGEYAPVRPWENLLIPAGALAPREGRLDVTMAEPMEEMTYLDSASLVSYDLPPGWRMTLDERMGVNPPAPTGGTRFYRVELLPIRAINDRGADVTELVREADLRPAPPGKPDPRFIGRNEEHWIELTFPSALDAHAGVPTLLADGWIEYPYSQTMFAAWQAHAEYHAPTIEARDDTGHWQPILPEFGYPAGMPRQMSVPLVNLPHGCKQLRIRTNEEVYWDRLAVIWAEPCSAAKRTVLPLASAELRYAGFPERTIGPQRQTTFDYNRRRPIDDVRYLTGWYTRFGHVEELVSATDDAVATIGPGEEVRMQFTAPTAVPEKDWSRRYVLEVRGWCKDTDLFTKDGETVEPWPARAGSSPETLRHRDELHRRYNTRFEAGR